LLLKVLVLLLQSLWLLLLPGEIIMLLSLVDSTMPPHRRAP
jgi:hypothetical protein